ncbi:MAG: hypothetical protein DHS20C16_13930 [Phycisphaerae bacterium]|nr:MAG: hypothetical protein DHS20C16_13930 [Phycisphaerae bacterium]
MPKSKTGPALFELYNKGQGEKSETERVTAKRSPIAESASAFRATLANLAKTINRDGQSEKVEKPPERVSGGSSVVIDQGRLHVILTSRVSGIVLAVLLVGGIGVFSMGQWVGHRKGLGDGRKQARLSIQGEVGDEIATARKSPPVEGLFAGIGTSPVSSGQDAKSAVKNGAVKPRGAGDKRSSNSRAGKSRLAGRSNAAAKSSVGEDRRKANRTSTQRNVPVTLMAQPPSSAAPSSANARSGATWVKGLTYVVVQSFRSDALEDAKKAQAFLGQQGIDSEIIAKSKKPIRLIATKGFDHKNKTQNDLSKRYLKRIRTIGKSYSKVGGRYKLEGYLARLTKESW